MTKRIISAVLVIALLLTMLPSIPMTAQAVDGAAAVDAIDFTNPADAVKFEIRNNTNNIGIVEGEGLTLISSRPAFEPCKGQNTGSLATDPEEVVAIPVSGDSWTVTLKFSFNDCNARQWYQFFGFYAAEGNDYQNLVGIRGEGSSMQDFLRLDGTVREEWNSYLPGLLSGTMHWYRIEKTGTTYICKYSNDGEAFTEMFRFEDTGIQADSLVIDAYSGMATGYAFTLKSLSFGEDGGDDTGKVWTVILDWNDGTGETTELKVPNGGIMEIPQRVRPGFYITRWTTNRTSGWFQPNE